MTAGSPDRRADPVPPHASSLAPRAPLAPAAALALKLWLTSMLCWWGIGVPFSRLWWLVNASQQRWILICYAWEVPAVGWTGAVLLPFLAFRRLQRRLEAGDPRVTLDLARFPLLVALLVIGTSSFGYLLGAFQVDYFTHLPPLEFAKITVQGPVLGGLFAVAAYLMAERAVERLGPPRPVDLATGRAPMQALYGKILSITLAVAFGTAVPVFLYGLTQWQRLREQTRAEAMLAALSGVSRQLEVQGPMAQFGPHTEAFVVRRSNNFIVAGTGAGRVLYGDGRRDFQPIQQAAEGWFASRDDEHKVVAFQHRLAALPDGDGAVLVAVSPFTDYGGEILAAAKPAAVVAGGALAVALALAVMLARSISDPVGRLRAAATQMANGDLAVAPVALARGDEIAALADAFDRMAARVRTDEAELRSAYDRLQRAQSEIVQHERLSAVGRVVSGVAHELNNPLTAVLHLAEDLGHGAPAGRDREALELIASQARRCRSIVLDLLSFARGRDRAPEGTDLLELVRTARQGVAPLLRSMEVDLEVDAQSPAPLLWVDRVGLEQVLTNLIVNGAQAAGAGGQVRVRAAGDDQGWTIAVEDSGAGIAEEVLPRIFEPFFTTRPQGKGTGLGLSVSLGIVERQGGTIVADRGGENRGARFTVRIPLNERTAAAPAAEHTSGPTSGPTPGTTSEAPLPSAVDRAWRFAAHRTRPMVLVIDDEQSVRMALARYFERTGWDVRQAEGGEEALEHLSSAEAPDYQLVITDLRMPGRNGIEVHDWMAEHRPDLFERLLVATGDVASPLIRDFIQRTPRPVLEKPFELTALAALVAQVAPQA